MVAETLFSEVIAAIHDLREAAMWVVRSTPISEEPRGSADRLGVECVRGEGGWQCNLCNEKHQGTSGCLGGEGKSAVQSGEC